MFITHTQDWLLSIAIGTEIGEIISTLYMPMKLEQKKEAEEEIMVSCLKAQSALYTPDK